MQLSAALKQLQTGTAFTADEALQICTALLETYDDCDRAALLSALTFKGFDDVLLSALANTLYEKCHKVDLSANTIDVCGTGGDGHNTYNISTAVAFVLAACGAKVTKHGNKAASSSAGSSDVLSALNITQAQSADNVCQQMRDHNLSFLFAPAFHPVLKGLKDIRSRLGIRTIINFAAPLANPARPSFQLLGVGDKTMLEPMAKTLLHNGIKRALVVHGDDGMDEITLTGNTQAIYVHDGKLEPIVLSPADVDLTLCSLDDLKGGDAAHNAQAMLGIFSGVDNAYAQVTAFNAGAGLWLCGLAESIKDGTNKALHALNSGAVLATYKAFHG